MKNVALSEQSFIFAFRRLTVVAALCSIFVCRSAAADEGKKPAPETADVIELSPFVVNAEKDSGYSATSTLAGTRLNTPLQDIGAAVSVYTKDLLNDIAATNSADLLVYATGAEAGGVNGNFTGASVGTDFASAESTRTSPESSTRIRGLSSASLTRDYYLTNIPFESYNTSQVTVNRGPNAVLFGLGSPSGIIDHGLIKATYTDKGQVSFRCGTEGSIRSTLDINKVIVPGKLALRAALLYKNDEYTQRPAYERDRRYYLNMRFDPFRRTTLRVSAEGGSINANRPNPFLALDNITEWMKAGKPVFDFATYDRSTALNAGNLAPSVAVASSPADTILVFYNQPTDSVASYAGRSLIASSVQTKVSPLNLDGQAETYRFYFTKNLLNIASSARYQGFTPSTGNLFDWEHNLLEGNTAYQNSDFDTLNVALSQQGLNDHVGIELSGDWQNYKRLSYQPFANRIGSQVYVDINTTLPNGQVNPNLGRPFLYTGAVNQSRFKTDRETLRATGFARYDFREINDHVGKWLGRHVVTGLAEQQTIDTLSAIEKLVLTGAAQDQLFGTAVRPQNRQPNRIVYLGSSILGASSTADVQLQPMNIPIWTPGLQIPVEYYDPITQSLKTETEVVEPILNGGSVSRERIRSYAGILQSYWLSEHIVTLFGWRQDESRLYNNSTPPTIPNDPGQRYTYDGFVPPSEPTSVSKGNLKTYSVVAKVPAAWRTRVLPAAADVSVFYNYSQNYSTTGGRVNHLGQDLAAPQGETKEVGLNVSFGPNRWSLRYNYFETSALNATYTSASSLLSQGTGVLFFNVLSAWEMDRNNGVDRSAEIARLLQGVPEGMKSVYNYSVVTDATGKVSAGYRNPTGLSDTADSLAKGHELELVINPSRSWRIMLNVARQESVLTNIAPGTNEWLKSVSANWAALANSPIGSAFNVNLSNPASYTSLGKQVGNTFNVPLRTLMAQSGSQALEQRKWRANLVTNYRFLQGRLKGWSIGTGVRWQDKANVGYIIVPQSDGSSLADIDHPVTKPGQLNVDGWLGYERKLRKNLTWKVQLNVKNIVYDHDLQPVVIQPSDGSVAQYSIPNARTWYLSNTLSF